MTKINISDMGNDKNVTTEEMAQVKGGPHWTTWDPPTYVTQIAQRGNVTLKRG